MVGPLQTVPHIFALTTRAGHGFPKSHRRFAAPSGSGSMPRCWLKTTTKTRRPLKSGTNG